MQMAVVITHSIIIDECNHCHNRFTIGMFVFFPVGFYKIRCWPIKAFTGMRGSGVIEGRMPGVAASECCTWPLCIWCCVFTGQHVPKYSRSIGSITSSVQTCWWCGCGCTPRASTVVASCSCLFRMLHPGQC